jgi:hypothetical protein
VWEAQGEVLQLRVDTAHGETADLQEQLLAALAEKSELQVCESESLSECVRVRVGVSE